MIGLGKALVATGLLIALAGALLLAACRAGLPLGRLPGDIAYRGRHVTFFFPLGTCLVLSIVVSVLLYVLSHLKR
jgi:di/tricarboxylate transporter